jgi:hypothetical protein
MTLAVTARQRASAATALVLLLVASATCTACPTNAVSVGSSSCVCPAGYTGDAGVGDVCVACESGTFKPFDGSGSCLPCPGDAASAEGAISCACAAGHSWIFPSLSCSGSCPCSPWVGLNESTISSNSNGSPAYDANEVCVWTISGGKAQASFRYFETEGGFDYVYVDECVDSECTTLGARFAVLDGLQAPGLSYQSSTAHLRIRFTSDEISNMIGFTATVSGGASVCSPCEADTYKAASDASECTACPTSAVSAVGSTALSSCVCPAGYTGDAGVGGDCVACEAGFYKDVSGSARCTACLAGTFKPFDGSGSCVPCPGDAASAEGAMSCACAAGHSLFVPSLSCSGSCPCSPWVGLNESTISSNSEGSPQYDNTEFCEWTISGGKAQVSFGYFETEGEFDYVYVDECVDSECTTLGARLASLDGQQAPGLSYQSSTAHLRIRFTSDDNFNMIGFTATVSGGPSSCVCSAGSRIAYRDVSGCTRLRGQGSGAIRSVSETFGVGTRKVTVNNAMQWRPAAGPPQQRFDQSVAGVGGKLYMFGDADYSSLLSFDPQVMLLLSCGSRISARTRCPVPAC